MMYNLFSRLNRRAEQLGKSLGYDFFAYDEHLQEGSSFGQRLSNAVTDLFGKGYDQVVVLGNDHIDISACEVNHARKILKDHKLPFALAPSADGGIAFVVLTRDDFDQRRFESLPWKTDRLFEAMCVWADYRFDDEFDVKHDLDAREGVQIWLSTPEVYDRLCFFLRALLRSLILSATRKPIVVCVGASNGHVQYNISRGPPLNFDIRGIRT